jgi:hypothetical protein
MHVTVLLWRLKGITVGSVAIHIIHISFADSNRIQAQAQAQASLGSRRRWG